jgi:hypothetical protein
MLQAAAAALLMPVDMLRNAASFGEAAPVTARKTVFGLGRDVAGRGGRRSNAESGRGKPIRAAQTGGTAVKCALGWPRMAPMDLREE